MSNVTYHLEYKDDKKTGKRYGPYWYAYWRENGKLRKKYYGKQTPEEVKKRWNEEHREVEERNRLITRVHELETALAAQDLPALPDTPGKPLGALPDEITQAIQEATNEPQANATATEYTERLEKENKRLKKALKDAEGTCEYWQAETLGRDSEIEALQRQVAELKAEREMLTAQRDTLLYELPKPTDSEVCGFTQRLHREPESIRDFIKRTRYRKEHLAWLISTHYEELDQLGIRFGEPHAGTKESGLWLMNGQVISSLWWEDQKV